MLSHSEKPLSTLPHISPMFSSGRSRVIDFTSLMMVSANHYLDRNSPERWASRCAGGYLDCIH